MSSASPTGFDDRLNVGAANGGTALPPGSFVGVTSDCRAGEPAPSLASFACTANVSTLGGAIIPSACTVAGLVLLP